MLLKKKMHEIVSRDEVINREIWKREDGLNFFNDKGEHFKSELISSIPEGEEISVYKQGSFVDLCKGPHLPSTKHLGDGFKLLKVAGAYWRGDHNQPMLQIVRSIF